MALWKNDPYFTYTNSDGEISTVFDENIALLILLHDEVIMVDSVVCKSPDKEYLTLYVICNDVFVPAVTDAVILPYDQIQTLYDMYMKDDRGSDVWCCIQRNLMPSSDIEKEIREQGVWDLDSYNLQPNTF